MLNRCEFIGRLGKPPEERKMQDGSPVVNISLGVTEKWKSQDGTKGERTEWVRVVVFNEQLCKIIMKYLSTGDLVRIVGAMQTRKWTDQSGQEKYTTEIVLQRYRGELTMLGGRGDNQGQGGGFGDSQSGYGGAGDHGGGFGYTSVRSSASADLEDEIPF